VKPIYKSVPPDHWERAQELRRDSTPAERLLWKKLRGRQTGFRFRRQHAVGPYIVDFFCWDARLVVEVDGDTHVGEEAQAYDHRRDEYLRSLGLQVKRYTNNDVLNRTESVTEDIWYLLENCRRSDDQTPPQPSP
jgi:very-short-patch-repair endonuclease